MMHGRGKSDRPTVPRKLPNNAGRPAAEAVEGKGLAEGNSPESNAFRTQRRVDAHSALERVRRAARKDRKQRFTALFHHVYDIDRLRTAYLPSSEMRAQGSMAKHGNATARISRATLQISPVGCDEERITRSRSDVFTYRSQTADSGRSGYRRWRTRSSSVRSSTC
jgi:hypothetical protein